MLFLLLPVWCLLVLPLVFDGCWWCLLLLFLIVVFNTCCCLLLLVCLRFVCLVSCVSCLSVFVYYCVFVCCVRNVLLFRCYCGLVFVVVWGVKMCVCVFCYVVLLSCIFLCAPPMLLFSCLRFCCCTVSSTMYCAVACLFSVCLASWV